MLGSTDPTPDLLLRVGLGWSACGEWELAGRGVEGMMGKGVGAGGMCVGFGMGEAEGWV